MADEQDHTEKDPDFCNSVLAENIGNTVDAQSQQQGPLGETTYLLYVSRRRQF